MRQPLGRRQPRLLRFADIAVRPVIPDSPFNQGPNKVWRLSGSSFFFWTFGPAEPARHLISAAHHVQLSLPKGDVTMRIKGNVKPRRGAGCLNGGLVGQCQGQPAYRLAKGISTDTRCVSHRRLGQMDSAVGDATKDVEGTEGGDRLAMLACSQLQGSPLCPRGTIAMLQEPCLPKSKSKNRV